MEWRGNRLIVLYAAVLVALTPSPDPVADSAPAAPDSALVAGIIADALSWLGVPYIYGGTGPDGFDCSGLIYRVFLDNGIELPRTAGAMEALGSAVSIEDLAPGDLVFFDSPGHVGLYIGGGSFIHSSSWMDRGVVITMLDQPNYARRYSCARRLI